jgi:hypothetical protein
MLDLRRRQFLMLLGGAAAWPLIARAQHGKAVRRIGILMPYPPTDIEYQSRVDMFRKELHRLGWTRGDNIEFDERWTTDNLDLGRANAANLVELRPDVIVAIGGRVIPVLLQLTRAVPIVIPGTIDPVGTGWVKSLAQPGGNITGFTLLEFSMFGKLLDLLKQLAPGTVRVGLVFNPCLIPTIRTVISSGEKSRGLPARSGSSRSSSPFTGSPTSIARLASSPGNRIRQSIFSLTSPSKRWHSRSLRSATAPHTYD